MVGRAPSALGSAAVPSYVALVQARGLRIRKAEGVPASTNCVDYQECDRVSSDSLV